MCAPTAPLRNGPDKGELIGTSVSGAPNRSGPGGHGTIWSWPQRRPARARQDLLRRRGSQAVTAVSGGPRRPLQLWIASGARRRARRGCAGGQDGRGRHLQTRPSPQAEVVAHYSAAERRRGRDGEPASLDGAILRVDPRRLVPGCRQPLSSSATPTRTPAASSRTGSQPLPHDRQARHQRGVARRRGLERWEESTDPVADRLAVENFGWPCYEGTPAERIRRRQPHPLRDLYSAGSGAVAATGIAYNHSADVAPSDTCPTGSSSLSGMAFYPSPAETSPPHTAARSSSPTTPATASG